MSTITITNPDGTTYTADASDAIVVHGVNVSGAYLGLVAPGAGVTQVPGPPPDVAGWTWDGSQWVADAPSLTELKAYWKTQIEGAAGQARMRNRTDYQPFQDLTSLQKLDQAKAFIAASYLGTAGPYIVAEATSRSMTTTAVADAIVADAAAWDGTDTNVGPAIEAERVKGLAAVDSAANSSDVLTAASGSITVLDSA